MEDKNLELQAPDKLLEAVDELRKKIADSNGRWTPLEEQFEMVRNRFEHQTQLQEDYRLFFAALLQEITDKSGYDRYDPVKSPLYEFSKKLAKKVQERDQLEKEKEQFQKEKTDRESVLAKMKEECRKEAQEEINKELDPLRTELTAKQNELQALQKKIADAEKELQTKIQQIEQFGRAAVSAPAGDCPLDIQKVKDEFDREGYAMPSEINPWGLYLCTQYAYIDITNSSNVMRSKLQELDEEEFSAVGKPQIVFRRQNGGWAAFPTALRNTINGKPLEEETRVSQGAIIVMTDKKGKEHTVKLLIGM